MPQRQPQRLARLRLVSQARWPENRHPRATPQSPRRVPYGRSTTARKTRPVHDILSHVVPAARARVNSRMAYGVRVTAVRRGARPGGPRTGGSDVHTRELYGEPVGDTRASAH